LHNKTSIFPDDDDILCTANNNYDVRSNTLATCYLHARKMQAKKYVFVTN